MGVEGLWTLLQNMGFRQTLKDFNVEHRFVKNFNNAHAPIVGVDASVLLDTFHAADRGMKNRTRNLHTSDTTLTQFQRFLCQLSEAGLKCIFCFDGPERPSFKRGRAVINRESSHYKHAQTLIELFGYHVITAQGDADAELAVLNRTGVIDAVLTKDSDVFPFGAICVLRVPPFTSQQSNELVVEVYDAPFIHQKTGITIGGFILLALLLRSDISNGISGIGAKTAFGLAQCGFGDNLLNAFSQRSTSTTTALAFQQINTEMTDEIKFNSHGKIGVCSPVRANKLRESGFPSLKDLGDIEAFATPPISSQVYAHPPRLPNIEGIASFCRANFGWTAELTLRKLHMDLWPAVVMQMLCSQYVVYNPTNAEFLTPAKEPTPDNLELTTAGRQFIPTYSISVLNKKLLDVHGKKPTHSTCIDFGVNTLIQLTGLAGSQVNTPTRRRLKIHSVIIAYAMNNRPLNNSLGYTLPTASSSRQPVDSIPHTDNEVIELTDSDSNE
ncbi:PIN domain-like protein [Lentinula raphanica]|nr:PIN domain-like protein [Lentinula raphanica]